MAIFDGQPVDAATVNAAFMSRTSDTSTNGKVTLENAGSSDIDDAQKYINKIAESDGIINETDTTNLDYSSNNYVTDGDNRKVAIGKLDQATKVVADDLAAFEASTNSQLLTLQGEIDAAESRLDTLEANNTEDVSLAPVGAAPNANGASLVGQQLSLQPADATNPGVVTAGAQTIGGNKTFNGNVVVGGDLTVNGTLTTINSTTLEVSDASVLVNNGGNDLSAEGAGLEVERPAGNAGIQFDSALTSKFKIGLLTNLYEVLVSGVAQTISGLKTFLNGLATDTISENTLNAGVTVDGVLIKDGLVDGEDVSDIRADLTTAEGTIVNHEGRITTLEGNNTQDVTLAPVGVTPNADGATLTGQVLNLEPADDLNPGVVSTVGQSFSGNKLFKDEATFEQGLISDTGIQTNGTEIWSVANDTASSGGSTTIPDNGRVATRLTNAALSEIQMLGGESTGRLRMIINDTGNVITLKHQTGANPTEQLSIGGADVSLSNGGVALFMWDTSTYWRLVQIVGGGAGGGSIQGVHRFQVNGLYSRGAALTGPDGAIFFNEPVQIVAVLVYVDIAGSSGATTFRLLYKAPAGAYVNMMTTDGLISSAAGNDAEIRTGETKANMTAPVLTATPFLVAAGGGVRLDIPTQQGGSPNGCGCVIFYEKQ